MDSDQRAHSLTEGSFRGQVLKTIYGITRCLYNELPLGPTQWEEPWLISAHVAWPG